MSETPFQFDLIRAELSQPGDGNFRNTEWLAESRRAPDLFRRELLQYYAARTHVRLKSQPDAGYDFYHDLILRHLQVSRPAFCWTERNPALHAGRESWLGPVLHSLTYAQIHAQCSLRCASWSTQGVRQGEFLCIIAPMGPELLIDLLSGLRMGLRVSLLPPLGPDFLSRRLKALPEVRIATAERYRMLLGKGPLSKNLLAASPASSSRAPFLDATSHTYAPKEPALGLFSPLSEPQEEPIEVLAADAYGGALRDGLLLLRLQPGTGLAAPEHHLLQFQPALLLSALLHGAIFLHLQPQDLVADSALLAQTPLDVLLVSQRLRDAMLQLRPRPLSGLKLWIVNPLEPPAQAWEDWARSFGVETVPAAALLVDSAAGGSLLFSLSRRGSPPRLLQPAPGQPFTLLAPDDSGQPATAGYGVFDPMGSGPGILLASRDGAYVYAGTLAPTRRGHGYPCSEVEAVVAALPFVLAASVVSEPGDSGTPILLIFTGPESLAAAGKLASQRDSALRQRIRSQLGDEFVPLLIEQYAMFPRGQKGSLNHAWCAEQYRRGGLRRREQHSLFRLLDRLRLACQHRYSLAAPAAPAQPKSASSDKPRARS